MRHIVCLSGGKDSTAVALYMRERLDDIEFVFADTGKELPETYEYIARLEAFLGQPIVRLNPEKDFDHWLTVYGGYLPSARARWCTRMLKIRPLEDYIGDDPAVMYIGIRADEDREGYVTSKPNVRASFPLRDAGIVRRDVFQMLEDAGVGLPDYYRWRSRSGCYFCFFQAKIEWVGLMREHPDLFQKAKSYETEDPQSGRLFTWCQDESLDELSHPDRVAEIVEKHQADKKDATCGKSGKLVDIFASELPNDQAAEPCVICSL